MSKTLTMATRLNPDPITTSKTHKFWYQGSFAVLNLSLEGFFCCFPICVTMVEWTFEDCESRKVHKSQFIQFPFLLKTTIWAKKTGGTNCKRMNYASHEMGNMTKTVAADLDKPSSSLHLYVETCDIWPGWQRFLPDPGVPGVRSMGLGVSNYLHTWLFETWNLKLWNFPMRVRRSPRGSARWWYRSCMGYWSWCEFAKSS